MQFVSLKGLYTSSIQETILKLPIHKFKFHIMKKILLSILFVLFFISTHAQTELAYNSESGMTEMQQIFLFEGKSSEEIYNRTKSWIVKAYKNPEHVVVGEAENEVVKINGAFNEFYDANVMSPSLLFPTYTLRIDIKDGKARITINDIKIKNELNTYEITYSLYKKGFVPKTSNNAKVIRKNIESQANSLLISFNEHVNQEVKAQNDDW